MEIRLAAFDNDKVEYLVPSWSDMDKIIFNMSKKINKDGLKFDRVVTLSKGGWPMSRSLVDYTGVEEVASIGLKYYSSINERLDEPIIYQLLPVEVEGENILLFDDVADTGESLDFVLKYLKKRNVKSVVVSCLFYKTHSIIKPDYYGEKTNDWIIFPYELKETMEVLVEKWTKQGVSDSEIIKRFEHLGFEKEKINYFLKIIRKNQ